MFRLAAKNVPNQTSAGTFRPLRTPGAAEVGCGSGLDHSYLEHVPRIAQGVKGQRVKGFCFLGGYIFCFFSLIFFDFVII